MCHLFATCVLAAMLSAIAQSPAMPDADWKRWLEEVKPLLTDTERTEAAKWPAQERETFREKFWARRNSSGPDAGNQQRTDFESRVREADKRFRGGRNGAWNDCGRVFVLLGKPDRVSNRTSATHFAGDDRLKAFRDQEDSLAEVWFYRNPPRLPAAPQGYAFRFTETCEAVGGPSVQRLLQQIAATYLVAR